MNQFVHCRLGHFLMSETDGEGSDLGVTVAEEEQEEQEQEEEPEEQEEQEEESKDDGGEVVVTIGDEKSPEEQDDQAAPAWVKDLRKSHREAQKRIRELEAQVKKDDPATKVPELGKKPSMDDPDIDYDAEKFETRLTEWHERKREIDQAQDNARKQEQKQQEEWQQRLGEYSTAKSGLKVKDFDDAEDQVRNSLNVTQQGIIIQGAENPALVVYALGKNPKKAAELAAINDHVKFAFAIAKLETQLKVQSRKPAPPPEKTVTGTGKVSGSVDSTLERLRAEAEKTGDMTKVNAYRRQQREKARNS
ncbi:hypothetical protein SAMN05660489_04383 [Pseudomonas sp. LAMO17WK12:I10]|uniref:hypothetical protein n=1 Tax=unclassified Pseudomonas TaxID=196821 RepID=UPI000BD4162C|nr:MULTISPECIES: hypothetical protein [unclassified Pseudomonas]PXX60691.1 hypothetical protein H160_04367 [Pseudomonas sp. LAMO17WK12:I9]SNY45557.1 hypothetical protein SAMN05660489_04383 [Pseudomonas sp. LAMO17WK12:I10]